MKSKSSGWLWALGALAAAGGGYWYWDKTRKREYLVAYMRFDENAVDGSAGTTLVGKKYFDSQVQAQQATPPKEVCDMTWMRAQIAKGSQVEYIGLIVSRTEGPVGVLKFEKSCGVPGAKPVLKPMDREGLARLSGYFLTLVPNMAQGGPAWYNDLANDAYAK